MLTTLLGRQQESETRIADSCWKSDSGVASLASAILGDSCQNRPKRSILEDPILVKNPPQNRPESPTLNSPNVTLEVTVFIGFAPNFVGMFIRYLPQFLSVSHDLGTVGKLGNRATR